MTSHFRLLIFILLIATGFRVYEKNTREPLHFSMKNEWQEVTLTKDKFSFLGLDSVMNHTVQLLSNELNQPRLFYCDLETAVCADGECRLARIKIYWNLLGNYVGYGIHSDEPLTKYDHDPFLKDDYDKLHRLFLDNNSVLRRKTMYELVDKVPVDPASEEKYKGVDGMSSATKKDIADAVVKGGLYSCYTLWHLIHGEAKEKMKSYLKSIESDSLITYFLYSDYKDYQLHALKYLSKEAFTNHSSQVTKIFKEAQPMIRTYILKKIPDEMLGQEEVSQNLYNDFASVGINSRTQLVNKLKAASEYGPETVSNHLDLLTRNQLKSYLNFFAENPEKLSASIESKLYRATDSKSLSYGYLIQEFLDND